MEEQHSQDDLMAFCRPGCGNPVLAKVLIDEKLLDDGSATVYYFFKDNKESDLFREHASKAIDHYGSGLRADFDALWNLWTIAIFDPSNQDVVCVIDALDECRQPDRHRLIAELDRFYTFSPERSRIGPKVKFLIMSRPYGDIERRYGRLTNRFPTIRLAGEEEWVNISQEIGLVMQVKVDETVEERGLSDEIRKALKSQFSETRNTTFL
ncbi:hypothetical protein N7532_006484 [Penicillium argentinense]|uniref:Nephrocystin 3-like N-terminal domain-containing protein n=1 Tax=Penicillium argentinense TaxID=1131581 RepID=A0A9W9FFZ1_9EURO|nr:uncharacterized protein N7532_006484 [Penicillium argentinense]KAJ5099483.1 hypothetical protein N7532_006484 [Penicillium argentinense]